MVKNKLQLLEELNHLTKRGIEIDEELLKSPNFDKEPLSKEIEDYTNLNERLEKLISEEYAKVQK
jgi:hypothetical protein